MKAQIAFVALAFAGVGAAEQLEPLFDGKSIDGWRVRNGTASYVVEDGAIVGTTAKGSPNSFLSPPRDYGDFILEFETLCDPALNSGRPDSQPRIRPGDQDRDQQQRAGASAPFRRGASMAIRWRSRSANAAWRAGSSTKGAAVGSTSRTRGRLARTPLKTTSGTTTGSWRAATTFARG